MRIRLLASMMVAVTMLHCSDQTRTSQPEQGLVEHHAGEIVITTPPRGSFITDETDIVQVTGTGGKIGLTVNGKDAEVAHDGTWEAKIRATHGMNVIVATDGESRVERAFLWGKFAPADQPVPKALAVEIGQNGLDAPPPAASLSTIANAALQGRDLIGALRGQTFSGTMTGATWTFEVTGGHNGNVDVGLSPAKKGAAVDAQISDVVVNGRLTIKLGVSVSKDVQITVSKATVNGNLEISVDEKTGALGAAMPNAEAKLDGFHIDTDNLGIFPCCADSILSTVIRGKIQDAVRDAVREQMPELVKLTLDQDFVPKEINLSKLGLPTPIPVAMRFDGSDFDDRGGSLTAALHFGGKYTPDMPGSKAPGWLTGELGYTKPDTTKINGLGISLALDGVNQFLFAAWAPGTATFHLPSPVDGDLTPGLPPVVSVGDQGALRIGVGDLVVQRADSDSPLAAATLIQDLTAGTKGDDIVLEPKGEPTISLTWLTDSKESSGKTLIVDAAKEQLKKFLDGFKFSIPKISLNALGGGLTGKSLVVGQPKIVVDPQTGRLRVTGAMTIK